MHWLILHGAAVWQLALTGLGLGGGPAAGSRVRGRARVIAAPRRRALGDPRARLDGVSEGDVVTLAGRLRVSGTPCQRFEDGVDAAAASAGSTSVSSVVEARAERITLVLDGATV